MGWVINNNSSYVGNVKSPREFYLNEFNDHTLRAFSQVVNEAINLGQAVIPIYIESDGGRVDIMQGIMSIMDYARTLNIKFATIVNGRAMSAGGIIFFYGDKDLRFIGNGGKIMIHSAGLVTGGKLPEVKMSIDLYHKEQDLLFERISKHLGKSKTWMKRNLEKRKDYDWVLSAQEAEVESLCSMKIPTFVLSISHTLVCT